MAAALTVHGETSPTLLCIDYVSLHMYLLLGLVGMTMVLAFLAGCWCYWRCCSSKGHTEKEAKLTPGVMTTMNATTLYQIPDAPDSFLN